MEIINRTEKVLTYLTQTTVGLEGWSDITWEWIYPGQSHEKGQGQDEVLVSVASGKISTGARDAFHANGLIEQAGPYSNRTAILLVNDGRTIVDWGSVKGRYLDQVKPVTADPEKPNPDLQQGLQVASAVLAACATGLAATGPVGAVPAGMVHLISSMMMLAGDEEQPPQPPNVDQIEAVVERVVKEQSDKDFALQATSSFLLAQQWLLDQDAEFRAAAAKDGRKQGPHDLVDDFRDHLERWADPNGNFYTQLDRMRRNPEIAKWIISQFIAGVGAFLQIWRLHAVVNHQASRATIEQFQREVDLCSKALLDAAAAWWAYIRKQLQNDKIYGTPEGTWAYQALNRAYVGVDTVGPIGPPPPPTPPPQPTWPAASDTTPVGSAIFRLNQISGYLKEDISAIDSGGVPTHFYKKAWEAATVES